MTDVHSEWTISLQYPPGFTDLSLATEYFFWTGKKGLPGTNVDSDGSLTLGGQTYISTQDLLEITGVESRLTEVAARPKVAFSGVNDQLRTLLVHDPGRVDVEIGAVRWDSPMWVALPRKVRGLLTDPVMQGLTYTFEVTPFQLDVDRGDIRFWTDEDHRRRNSGDGIFQHVRAIADGIDIRWPP